MEPIPFKMINYLTLFIIEAERNNKKLETLISTFYMLTWMQGRDIILTFSQKTIIAIYVFVSRSFLSFFRLKWLLLQFYTTSSLSSAHSKQKKKKNNQKNT